MRWHRGMDGRQWSFQLLVALPAGIVPYLFSWLRLLLLRSHPPEKWVNFPEIWKKMERNAELPGKSDKTLKWRYFHPFSSIFHHKNQANKKEEENYPEIYLFPKAYEIWQLWLEIALWSERDGLKWQQYSNPGSFRQRTVHGKGCIHCEKYSRGRDGQRRRHAAAVSQGHSASYTCGQPWRRRLWLLSHPPGK